MPRLTSAPGFTLLLVGAVLAGLTAGTALGVGTALALERALRRGVRVDWAGADDGY